MAAKYVALVGLNYPVKGKEVRREPGQSVDDLPLKSIAHLLKSGAIEEVQT